MKIKTNILLASIMILLLLIQSCKCDNPNDPSCPNYDPCLNVSADFANFKMEERIMEFDLGAFVETQNTVERNTIYFSVLDQSVDSVHWFVGNDPYQKIGKNIEVFFKYPFGEIEIKCIAYKSSVASCLGIESTIDTLVRVLNIREWWDVPYLGHYEGTSDMEAGLKFNSAIDTMTYYSGFGIIDGRSPITFLTNFPNGYQMPIPPDGVNQPNQPYTRFSYNGFITGSDNELFVSVAVYETKTKKIRIDYSYFTGKKYEVFKYLGEKI
jgi:hypothetical protein